MQKWGCKSFSHMSQFCSDSPICHNYAKLGTLPFAGLPYVAPPAILRCPPSSGGADWSCTPVASEGVFFIEIYLISIVAVIHRLLISIVLVCLGPLGAGGEFL